MIKTNIKSHKSGWQYIPLIWCTKTRRQSATTNLPSWSIPNVFQLFPLACLSLPAEIHFSSNGSPISRNLLILKKPGLRATASMKLSLFSKSDVITLSLVYVAICYRLIIPLIIKSLSGFRHSQSTMPYSPNVFTLTLTYVFHMIETYILQAIMYIHRIVNFLKAEFILPNFFQLKLSHSSEALEPPNNM